MILPLPVAVFICLLTLCLGVIVILIVRFLSGDGGDLSPSWQSHEDDGEILEIPLHPTPPVHVTRFGIHHDHVQRGMETEPGCPVCYQLRLHMRDPTTRPKRGG